MVYHGCTTIIIYLLEESFFEKAAKWHKLMAIDLSDMNFRMNTPQDIRNIR